MGIVNAPLVDGRGDTRDGPRGKVLARYTGPCCCDPMGETNGIPPRLHPLSGVGLIKHIVHILPDIFKGSVLEA